MKRKAEDWKGELETRGKQRIQKWSKGLWVECRIKVNH